MAINLKKILKKDIAGIKELRLGIASAGIKDDATDLLVIALPDNSSVAGVFTQNQFCAAPVIVSKDNLAQEDNIRALVINSGCANAGMGQQGMDLSLIHISEPTRPLYISYAVFCLKKIFF
mgnify:CR=1 FL=1